MRCERRRIVERFFAWMKRKRRLSNRYALRPENFVGSARVSTVVLLLGQFRDGF